MKSIEQLDKEYYHLLETNLFGCLLLMRHPLPPSEVARMAENKEIFTKLVKSSEEALSERGES